ncbi:response regulator containing a CheY-like receiver [Photorhabdus khanii NC19]|uniref:Response regulator containing a CheY-like receiver n=1 Tax=Photorhabdus khanii NC19 TaxID=1004151 RepID=W3V8B1_9GAMM|nr:PAS domain-containing protein [Photorhabdus khanii]ETS32023.1 response regulator containing a CheY-like receiver [Photorhabdus khanii NC19]
MKNYTISPQIINTMELSNEPWGIKDSSSCFIYGNLALSLLHDFQKSFAYEGLYDDELPWEGAKFVQEFVDHDKKVMEKNKRICSLETHVFGKEQVLLSYFCEKFPFYHEDGDCIGVIFHCWKAKDYSLTYLHQYYDKFPSSILLQPPTDLFTEREWDIIFFFLQKYTRKQIGTILALNSSAIENHVTRIYHKIGINSHLQLEEYCRVNSFNRYIPEKFLLS